MEKIPLKVWNRIALLESPIAAEINTNDARYRRWIAILPNLPSAVIPDPLPYYQYCIMDSLYDAEQLQVHALQMNEDLALINEARYFVSNENELYQQLAELEVDPTLFNSPWRVDHPSV
ncbi:hypothetical protein [Hymenobacter crusticola]|uniref:Uncharacterized protein n=1 Tax=Hymenobacter crusticola TaxID=1770526 RepID=A0A243WDU9_9BACT|nr:hypothetical protein [Hymenobacter crusticola]OUJ73833.1 hypothetical protein BXP70_12725 [Hymenobacter crusticola]